MSDDNPDDVPEGGIPIIVPQLNEANDPAQLSDWHIRAGDFVSAHHNIANLSFDKIDVDLEAPATGVLERDVPLDAMVKGGDVIGRILPTPTVDPAQVAKHLELLAAVAAAAPDDFDTRYAYAMFLVEAACPLPPWGARTTRERGEWLVAKLLRRKAPTPANWRVLDEVVNRLAAVANGSAYSLVVGSSKVDGGFVTEVSLPLLTFIERHDEIIRRAVLTGVTLSDLDAKLVERLDTLPRLPFLRSLTLVTPRRTFAGTLVERVLHAPIFATAVSYRVGG